MNITTLTGRAQQNVSSLAKRLANPSKLGWLATKFPKSINCFTTQKIINAAFAEQIADGDFDFLQDRVLLIEIIDAELFLALSFNNHKIICTHFDNNPIESDATLSIETLNAIQLIQQEIDPDTLFFQRKLKIKGDTELAHNVKNTIDTLDPDVIPKFIMTLINDYKTRVLES